MFRRVFKRIRLNFRETKSERVATQSYRDYHKRIRKFFTKAINFTKIRRFYDKG